MMQAEGKPSEEKKPDIWSTGSEERPRKESCVKYFDALWFCYSPVHQFQEFYCHGQPDDCFGHWSDLTACLKQRTKYADQAKESSTNRKHPLWTMRSKEEASQFWEAEFGNSKESGSSSLPLADEKAGEAATQGTAGSSGKPTVA